jgi:predicted small metal-binding protein
MSNTGYSCQECSWTVTADDVAEMSSQALDHHDETGHHVEYGTRQEQ